MTVDLWSGERVDGSSLFPGVFPTANSDVYVVPCYRWAFADPWVDDEMHIVCRFVSASGKPCSETPDNALATIAERMKARGNHLHGLAEFEFYILGNHAQGNYHHSAPYLHERPIADDILRIAARTIGHVKYCHAEVDYIDRAQFGHQRRVAPLPRPSGARRLRAAPRRRLKTRVNSCNPWTGTSSRSSIPRPEMAHWSWSVGAGARSGVIGIEPVTRALTLGTNGRDMNLASCSAC